MGNLAATFVGPQIKFHNKQTKNTKGAISKFGCSSAVVCLLMTVTQLAHVSKHFSDW
jgi:hypothetical protein